MRQHTAKLNVKWCCCVFFFLTFLSLVLMCHKFSVIALVSSPLWGCNCTADDDGWLTTAAGELSVFCCVCFTSVPLRKRCCLHLRGENPLMNNSSARQGVGGGEKSLFCVGDDIPRRWCHAWRMMVMMSPPNLVYGCDIVDIVGKLLSLHLHLTCSPKHSELLPCGCPINYSVNKQFLSALRGKKISVTLPL